TVCPSYFAWTRLSPRSALFPYTTLFRSGKLKALRRMQGHHGDRVDAFLVGVHVRDQGDVVQKGVETRLHLRLKLFRHRQELLEVLNAGLRLDALLRLELGDVAGVPQELVHQAGEGHSLRRLPQVEDELGKLRYPAGISGRDVLDLLHPAHGFEEADPFLIRKLLDPAHRGIADSPLG